MNRRSFIKSVSSALILADTSILYAKNKMYIKDSIDFTKNIHKDDVFVSKKDFVMLQSIASKLHIIQKNVGHGNLNIISFDEILLIGIITNGIKKFTKEEISLIEDIFYEKPTNHGFLGDRTCFKLTDKINKKKIKRVTNTGHYLYKGDSTKKYNKMCKDVGNNVCITSGVRSIVKQMSLYFDKIIKFNGNISKASNSIAPPAYSYHALGDFDIGKKGLGSDNFTTRFTKTKVFKKIKKLSYIDMRYTIDNKDGVRYEPWHVKIV